METNRASEHIELGNLSAGKRAQIAAVGGILLVALVARVFYAAGLPMSGDEVNHLSVARQISLSPGEINLPLDIPISGHPVGVLYLTALANWVGGGSLFGIRVVFIALHLFGLIGFYFLGASLFGPRVALIALALASADRHLIALAPVFLESPTVLVIAPWTVLQMYRCATRGALRDWLLAGLLFGLGFWISTLFLAMLLPFGLYILVTGRLKSVLTSRTMYAGLALMLAIILPSLAGDLWTGGSNYERNVDKLGSFGLSPRMAILYIGDLLICLKDPTWIVENVGGAIYLPIYVPCNWVMGLIYLGLAAFSLRYWHDVRTVLLLSVIVGFLIPVTLIDAREPWNEFTWASTTVFATVLLAAYVLDRMLDTPVSKVAPVLVGAWSVGAMVLFLAGPKWGYFCPEWERYYVGQVLSIETRAKHDPSRFPEETEFERIRDLTDEALARHPESVVAWYFRGFHARNDTQRRLAFEQALKLDPNNTCVIAEQTRALIETEDWEAAWQLLEPLASREIYSFEVYALMAEVNFRLGHFESSVRYAREYSALRPENYRSYQLLYLSYDAMGDSANAQSALKVYVARYPLGSSSAYLELARHCWQLNQPDKAQALLEQAIYEGPRDADSHSGIAFLLISKLHDLERALEHFRAAARKGSTDPLVYYNLGLAAEDSNEAVKAVDYYRSAIELNPQFGVAHLRLGWALSDLNQHNEARHHLDTAQRLGVQLPKAPPPQPNNDAP